MFLGTYHPRLDDKGRLILPAKFRDQLAGGLVLTKGQERCLAAYPMREFEEIHEQLRKAPITDRRVRDYSRVLLAGATDEQPDKQGRITIPTHLRQYAGLERELAVIGTGSRVEIWSAAAWDDYLAASEDAFADTAEEVVPGLF
ncbi:division/cell wall cluster transcriptional repressor MraZ [Georgenia satyanarayanai]|uniref:division/cell wall cluster transcriptional repressor MraZ n=1 Tax=Georgenia satyanarayanai TaxID=860221 RepID=UPI001264C2F8|nr:division/cell wall cluster transcriptional repressor MraZ [Georgenia satyanarayanai]